MKCLLILTSVLMMFQNLYAQTNTFPADGNVGIGTTNPGSKLEVNGGITTNNTSNINGLTFSLYNTYYRQLQAPGYNLNILSGDGVSKLSIPFSNSAPAHFQNYGLVVDGNVGIGVTPTEKLHVSGNSIITGIIRAGTLSGTITQTATYPYSTTIETGADAGQILINAGSTEGYTSKINISGRGNGAGIQFHTRSVEVMRISDDGNVGIGTQTPTYKLDVVNQMRIGAQGGSDVTLIGGGMGNGSSIQLFFADGTENTRLMGNNDSWLNVVTGNLGIGTTNPTEKLSVNGKIRAKEIKVEAAPWPDYVFHPSYKLPDLKDTEQFIKENKHLPEIPSAAEVEKNGVNLGEMNAKLLKKIEELTLYMIELKKENEQIKEAIKNKRRKRKL